MRMTEYNINASSPQPAAPDWKSRASLSLEQHWALAQDLLVLGRRILSRHAAQSQGHASLAQVERILQLATRLARLSTDLARQAAQSQDECPQCCAARREMEDALNKIYGSAAAASPSPAPSETTLPGA